jgi:putative transcriptional regulator
MQTIDLTHHFLIAMPSMVDPNFASTLTYVCEHNEQGAVGIVVNRPIDLTLGQLLAQVDLAVTSGPRHAEPIYFGGPVQLDRGFVLHRPVGQWQASLPVREDIALTTSRDILQAVAEGGGPTEMLVSLGYAGWAPGQLEDEIRQNAWLTVGAEPSLIFRMAPEERLAAAMALLGVDPRFLSDEAGHA